VKKKRKKTKQNDILSGEQLLHSWWFLSLFFLCFCRFYLRETQSDVPWLDNYGLDPQILRDFLPFLLQPENREYPDLCQLPGEWNRNTIRLPVELGLIVFLFCCSASTDLNESTLLENLRQRFEAGHIYTYVGSILIAVNPFKFNPIYNPKYVRLYQNQRIGPILPPHIFAIADNAYYCMLKEKKNQVSGRTFGVCVCVWETERKMKDFRINWPGHATAIFYCFVFIKRSRCIFIFRISVLYLNILLLHRPILCARLFLRRFCSVCPGLVCVWHGEDIIWNSDSTKNNVLDDCFFSSAGQKVKHLGDQRNCMALE